MHAHLGGIRFLQKSQVLKMVILDHNICVKMDDIVKLIGIQQADFLLTNCPGEFSFILDNQ